MKREKDTAQQELDLNNGWVNKQLELQETLTNTLEECDKLARRVEELESRKMKKKKIVKEEQLDMELGTKNKPSNRLEQAQQDVDLIFERAAKRKRHFQHRAI